MIDSAAIQQGYTDKVSAFADSFEMVLPVKPDTDLDGRFRAWDMDEQEFITVNGWMFEFDWDSES